jgi:GNAT superfamily N-acetyltransferase
MRYAHLTFPYFRPWLDQRDDNLVAIGARLIGEPIGLLLARVGDAQAGEIHSVYVAEAHRRRGIAARLLAEAECELFRRGAVGSVLTYMDGGPSTPALEGLLDKLGWGPPTPRMLVCRSDFETITKAPWMAKREFPAEFEVFQWSDLTASDREDILDRQRRCEWFPELLTPFWKEDQIEPVSSLGLRYRGEIVGWCISHRVDRETIRFARLFVRKDLQSTARAVALLAQSIYRHQNTEVQKAIYDVAAQNETMLRFVQRRLAPYMKSMRTIQRRAKRFDATLAREAHV